MGNKDFFSKSSKILRIIFIFLFLLVFRVWHLCVIQKDTKKMEAKAPQRRILLEKAQRGTIRDRFDLPLAMNRIRFNAAIYYEQILQIPRVKWIDKNGQKIKTFPRKDYIDRLAAFLSQELSLSKQELEDQIYAKATLFPHIPFVLKENIPEKTYYKLKFLERNWPGLYAEISSTRYYPKNEIGSSIIGTMGAINEEEFISNAEEIKILEKYLEKQFDLEHEVPPFGYQSKQEVLSRLKELKEKAYSVNDLVGKYGIEKKFEQQLRGSVGKKLFEVDVRGSFVKELPIHTKPIPGNNIKLTISAELQEYAEKLLAIREKTMADLGSDKLPWSIGGAIVAVDPNNGEVLALASYPNYNPNDFIPSSNPQEKTEKQARILKWLETKEHIGQIWDGKKDLTKKVYDPDKKKYSELTKKINWDSFITSLISENNEVFKAIKNIDTLKAAISVQEDVETILYFTKATDVELLFDVIFPNDISSAPKASLAEKELLAEKLKAIFSYVDFPLRRLKEIFRGVVHNKDKLLIVDIFRIAVFSASFSDGLISAISDLNIGDYFEYSRHLLHFEKLIKDETKKIFDETYFQIWRDYNLTDYLKEKRKEEKKKNTYARPYTDYIDQKKHELFKAFWEEHKVAFQLLTILGIDELGDEHFKIFKKWHEQLKESCFPIKKTQESFQSLFPFFSQIDKELVKDFIKTVRCFNDLNRPLYGKYRKVTKNEPKEMDLAMLAYPHEGFGYMLSYAYQCPLPLGSIFKVLTAYEALRQNDDKVSHFSMIDKVEGSKGNFIVGYNLNNKPYKRIYKKGRLPKSTHLNIGKIDFFSAMEQSSNPYFSILASDYIASPEDLNSAASNFGFGEKTKIDLVGEYRGSLPDDLSHNRTGLYSYAIGHHTLTVTPLQTALFLSAIANEGKLYKPKIVSQILGSYQDLAEKEVFLYQKSLQKLGIHVPVFSVNDSDKFTMVQEIASKVSKKIFMTKNLKDKLLKSMAAVIHGNKGTARASRIKALKNDLELSELYKQISKKMVGKTSTAEIFYVPHIAASEKIKLSKHVCFAAISFKESVLNSKFKNPDLVVIVYLPFGKSGKEAAPLAAQVIAKWDEIRSRSGRY